MTNEKNESPSAHGRDRGNYGKYPSIRIDNLTEQYGDNRLTDRLNTLKFKAPSLLHILFRVGG